MKNKKLLCSVCFLFALMSALCGQNITVKGNVTSKTDGQPIIGASVIETISTTNGTITDFDGNFTLSVPTNATLKISYIGYKPVTVKAATSIQVLLEEDTQMVDEVVVTGYTTQRKADLTGAVSVVKVDEIQKQGENNPVKALQGRVPGMSITADGNPSGTATVRIRGIGTLNNNDPLYIIDGVPSKAGMHELNGNDIESIQVLKDAASAIITTKQGRKGQIKINFDASVSASMYQSKLDMMNTEQYGRTLWQANVNSGKNPNANSIGYQYDWGYNAEGYPVLNNIYVPKFIDDANTIATGDTDWFDEITRTGFIQQYNLSLSNGTERGNYFFSLGYYKNDGLIKYTNFDRISARINSDYKVIDNILTIGEHFTLNRTTEVQAPGNIMSDAMIALPMIPVHTVDGTNWGGPNSTMPDRQNVARVIYDNRNNRYTYWRLFGDAYVNLNPVKGLNIRSTFGLDYAQKYQRNFTLPYNTGFLNSDKDAVEMKQEHFTKWMWNAVATYELEIGKHRGDVMAGMELNREDDINFAAYREGFAILTPDYMYPSAGVGQSQASGGAGGFSLVSYFGKLNYSYADKYLLSFTLRRDGSSRFGSNNKYATFPSVSLGWRISQEAFMEKTKDVIDDLKIRAAWGQTGNQDIENYARYSIYESKYGTGNPPTYGTSYDITGSNGGSLLPSGFVRTQIGNDDIKWETTTQTNVGMDFSLFNQTLYGSAEYYYKKTTDILIKPSYIGILGEGGGQWRNAGSMENKGFEFNLGYRNKTAFGLSYDINANLGLYRNKILFVPGEVASTGDFGGDGVMNIIGHSINMRAGYIADGIFKSQEEVDNHADQTGKGVGRIRYKDLDNNGVIDTKDQTWIGNPNPDFTYGLNIYLEYKNFDLTMFWQGVQGVDVYNEVKKNTDFWSVGDMNANRGIRLLGAWTPQNPGSDIPAVCLEDLNNEKRISSYYVENGSYLKLRNLQLGYTLPTDISKKIKMERLRFYFSAQNLLTIKSKNFTGMDPENPNFGYPIPFNLTFGFNIGF
ncbi:MAG: SusC/RagA family protein [Bacteroides finegoldii]|nr:MAG: SusC/RagA family protein [Bacteroides finegoldii]